MRPELRKVTALLVAVVAALSMTLVGDPTPPTAVAATEPCHPDHEDWPGCLPSEAELTEAVRTQPNEAFFWTGRVLDEAGAIARSFGGTTLERSIEEHGLRMPDLDEPRSELGDARWVHASREMARQASGIVFVVIGRHVRPGNTWEKEERPRVEANPDVTAIVEITERTGDERVIWRQDGVTEREIQVERARTHASRACPVWQEAGWPTMSDSTTNTQTSATTLSPTRPDEVLIGGEGSGWNWLGPTATHFYSVVPTYPLPESQRHGYVQWTPTLEAVFKSRATRPSYFYLRLAANDRSTLRLWPEDLGCKAGDGGHDEASLKKRDLRPMALGDSITYGKESSDLTGYRDELYDHMKRSARSVDFVGSVRAGSMKDPDNEGHPGDRIDEIAEFADCSVKRYQPNVIMLHAGTNDMNQNYHLPSAPDRLKELINQSLEDSPRATVLVAQLIPTGKAGLQPRIDAYNAALPGVVRDLQDEGKHVLLVSMDRVRVSDGLENDAHPSDKGYAKMADVWDRALWEAHTKGWIEQPAAQKPSVECEPDGSKAGPGWRALGIVAPGMTHPDGRTDLADFDGDGRDDYVRIDERNHTLRIALNREDEPGEPRWKEVEVAAADLDLAWYGDWKLNAPDIDGDGTADLLLTPPSGTDEVPRALFNTNLIDDTLSFSGPGSLRMPLDGVPREAIRFADVNGDGRDDFLRVGEDSSVHAYYNFVGDEDSLVRWEEHRNWAPGVAYGSRNMLRLADVNGDGKADYLMVGNRGAVHAYINNGGRGDGGFTEHRYFVKETGYPGDKSTFRDISGDGKADYVVVYDGGSVRAWLNRGGNT